MGSTCLMSSIGMAKPRPTLPAELPPAVALDPLGEYIAELMPMTCPEALISGPPELPGLSAASVWKAW